MARVGGIPASARCLYHSAQAGGVLVCQIHRVRDVTVLPAIVWGRIANRERIYARRGVLEPVARHDVDGLDIERQLLDRAGAL